MSREVSNELLELYEHWGHGLKKVAVGYSILGIDKTRLKEVQDFAALRMKAWESRQLGIYPTYDDQIISKFKFCNVYLSLIHISEPTRPY